MLQIGKKRDIYLLDQCGNFKLKRIKSQESHPSLGAFKVETKVKITKEGVLIPEQLFTEMMSTCAKMEQIVETIETLADKKTLKAIKKSRAQVAKGDYVECTTDDLEKVLK